MLAWCALMAALQSPPAVASVPDQGEVRSHVVEVTLVRVDFRRHVLIVAVPPPASREYDLVLDESTRLLQDGRVLVPADLPLGDPATVSWTDDDQGRHRAKVVLAGGRREAMPRSQAAGQD